jgi:6-phosphogluconolactonase
MDNGVTQATVDAAVAHRALEPAQGGALDSSLLAKAPRPGTQGAGVAYLMTNDPRGNAVFEFTRLANGQLVFADRQSTGGVGGTGNGVGDVDPLGSQNALVANEDASRLLAVNAGSDEISVLGVSHKKLRLLDKTGSGGDFPNSVALWRNLVYVLNARGQPNVSGFTLDEAGHLQPIAGSTRPLPGGSAAAPHDIRFSPDGTRLIVTEDGTNQIDIFDVGDDGLITNVRTQPSSGPGPFGFTFARDGFLVVTEAMSASVSSHELTSQNTLTVISPSVPNGQAASCWIALTPHGRAFVSNTASATISSYQVASDGHLTLANAIAAATGAGSAPIDAALSSDNTFLYVIDSALGRLLSYQVNGTGLSPLGTVTNLPKTLQGLVVR